MKKYELVFIDLDETLMDFRRAERQALERSLTRFGLAFSERTAIEYEEINGGVWRRLEKGELDQETLKVERFRLLFGRLGVKTDPRDTEAFGN
ncbi:MAG: HAD family hydrolase [Spirochaetae bacterium HGW-Spirochaetae-7]|jgi:2-haloacid dehalogenase|nr:MAG: HAD family hydrolase [Spirochaetae bacterium HGW-Spirochaetae-7]